VFSSNVRNIPIIHRVSKNDTDVAHYNFNARQPVVIFFGNDVAERVSYQMVIFGPPVLTDVPALPGEYTKMRKSRLSNAVLMVCWRSDSCCCLISSIFQLILMMMYDSINYVI